MSFFDSIPLPPRPERVRRRRPVWMRSEAVIPGPVPAEVVLIRTEQVAVAIGNVRAYPNGFEFTLHTRRRREDETGAYRGDPLERHARRRGPQVPEEGLRLGVMYADGRRAAVPGRHPELGSDPRELVVLQNGGSGGGRSWDGNVWVHPLPPEGPVTFVAAWLEQGVAETRVELDGAAICAAAARAVILWPEEPEFEPTVAQSSHLLTAGEPDATSAKAGPGQAGTEGADAGP